ncbi:MAG: NAD(P)H-hydrate dehydratase [Phycisphaeraceae bacterium]|nr:MAG: NAD(P)H-hydrate dehydratase [Phycisphaeraceae bacterium]
MDRTLPPGLPPRDRRGHKGTFGTVCVVGGSVWGGSVMAGAPALAALGALRAGAGRCVVVAPGAVLGVVLGIVPSATGRVLPCEASGAVVGHEAASVLDGVLGMVGSAGAVVVGPGLGVGPGVEGVVLRALQQEGVGVVVDADGLNAMARVPELFRDFRASAVLTPHPGEFDRLASSLGMLRVGSDDASRAFGASELARRLGCVVVLKGAGTVVSDGLRVWRCEAGHPCLATGGTGDVLAGVIAGVIAQHGRVSVGGAKGAGGMSLYDAARVGVLAHAKAGERWSAVHGAEGGALASEIAGLIPAVVGAMVGRSDSQA